MPGTTQSDKPEAFKFIKITLQYGRLVYIQFFPILSEDCLDDPLGCVLDPVSADPTSPLLLLMVGASAFSGGLVSSAVRGRASQATAQPLRNSLQQFFPPLVTRAQPEPSLPGLPARCAVTFSLSQGTIRDSNIILVGCGEREAGNTTGRIHYYRWSA